MKYKILESNGVENENVDGAALNNIMAGGTDGIFARILNECEVTSPTIKTIKMDTGVLMVQGFRVKITEPYEHTFSSTPAQTTAYHMVVKLSLSIDRSVSVEFMYRQKQSLTQQDIFKDEKGVYEAEIATFNYTSTGFVESIQRTMQYFYALGSTEDWKFTLADGTTVTKKVVVVNA